MNIETALHNASDKLKRSNIKSFNLDPEILMTKILKKNRVHILLNLSKKLELKEIIEFNNLIEERSKGKPIAYLMGYKHFWKHKFYIDQNVLIPRPDTEIIVEQALFLSRYKSKLNILDIGAGSGCILFSILSERKDFFGTGIDISEESLKVCKINAFNIGVHQRVKFFKTDIDNFKYGKYDLIISNPPYISTLDLKYLEKDIIKFEPKTALDGGIEGTSEIRKVIDKSSELIKKNGKLILEIGYNQKNKVSNMLKKKGFYIFKTLKDYAKNDRCIISTKL